MPFPAIRAGAAPAIAAAALAGLALTPAAAPAAEVTASKLQWSTANVFDRTQPSFAHRTWLGYITDTEFPAPRSSNGSARVSDGATLSGPDIWTAPGAPKTVVDGTAPRGADRIYTFSFPGDSAGRGTYDPATGTGTLEFTGRLTFTTHSLSVFLDKPQVTLNGTTGTLAASGDGSPNLRDVVPYDRSVPVFSLDLSDATITDHADGSQTIGNIVPTVASTQLFGSSYAAGIAGPNRAPNTFGSFAIRVAVPPIPATAVAGPPGPAGPQGPKGDPGAAGTRAAGSVARSYRYTLARAPFGTAAASVTVLARTKTTKLRPVTVGTVRGRTLRVKEALSRGVTYRLVRTNRFVRQRSASIRIR